MALRRAGFPTPAQMSFWPEMEPPGFAVALDVAQPVELDRKRASSNIPSLAIWCRRANHIELPQRLRFLIFKAVLYCYKVTSYRIFTGL